MTTMWKCGIVCLILAVVATRDGKSEDVVKIIVNQCESCDSSNFVITLLGANSSADVVQLAVPISSHFFIIQVHHYLQPMKLSYAPEANVHNSVTGTNIGLNQINQDYGNNTFYLFHNFTTASAVLFAVTSYSKSAPMPGGCNMEFNTQTAPYEKITYDDAMITVDVQTASINDGLCEFQKNITLDFYVLQAKNEKKLELYEALLDMMTPDSIEENGFKVIKPSGCPELRRYFNNYRGLPAIFVAVASYGNQRASYVPALTYGCDMTNDYYSCYDTSYYVTFITMYLVCVFSFILLLVPRTTNAISAFNLAFYGITALFVLCGLLSFYYTIGILVGITGIIVGLEWFYKFTDRSKYCNHFLSFYAASVMTTCIYSGTAIGKIEEFQTREYFWILYIVTMFAMMWPIFKYCAQAVAVVFNLLIVILLYLGDMDVLYIIVNAIHRMTVPKFYLASLYMDTFPSIVSIILFLIWLVFIIIIIIIMIIKKCGVLDDASNDSDSDSDNENAPLLP